MGCNKIDKESEKVVVKQLVAKALNTLRTVTNDYFHLSELESELPSISKTKRNYIFSRLINSGIIIPAGKDAFGKLYWFKDAKIPVSVVDISKPIEDGLCSYYSSVTQWNANYRNKCVQKEKKENKVKEEKEANVSKEKTFEEECIDYLLSTGKYKVYKIHTEWKEIMKD